MIAFISPRRYGVALCECVALEQIFDLDPMEKI